MINSSIMMPTTRQTHGPHGFATETDLRDRMMEGFGTEAAAPRQRQVFAAIALALCAVLAATYLKADMPLKSLPAFIPAFISAVIVTDLITAYLLFVHAPLSGRFDLLCLGGAYLFSSSMAIGQLLVFPGVASVNGLFGAGSQSAVWLWVFWHGGFPALVIVAMIVRWLGRQGVRFGRPAAIHGFAMTTCVLCLAVALEALVTQGQGLLPPLIQGRSYLQLAHSLAGRLVLILNFAALAVVLRVTRGRVVLDLGLSIALLASTIDAVLTMKAGARFSLGWYVARVGSVVSAVSVLIVYLREVTLLYARVIRLNERLAEQAAIDVTTDLYNRRHFNRHLHVTLRDASRRQESTGLLLIDIDHFKLFNDRYGHLAGDDCLHQVAQAIAGAIRRPTDVAARYGGEEFAVILPGTGATGANHMAQRVLCAIQSLALDHAASPTAAIVTASIGVGTAQPGARFEDLIREADEELYAAKRAGRNRVASA
jgi:diguanylate cyclase (GGDEF)-like protein